MLDTLFHSLDFWKQYFLWKISILEKNDKFDKKALKGKTHAHLNT